MNYSPIFFINCFTSFKMFFSVRAHDIFPILVELSCTIKNSKHYFSLKLAYRQRKENKRAVERTVFPNSLDFPHILTFLK
jgi:hypothetical protein